MEFVQFFNIVERRLLTDNDSRQE